MWLVRSPDQISHSTNPPIPPPLPPRSEGLTLVPLNSTATLAPPISLSQWHTAPRRTPTPMGTEWMAGQLGKQCKAGALAMRLKSRWSQIAPRNDRDRATCVVRTGQLYPQSRLPQREMGNTISECSLMEAKFHQIPGYASIASTCLGLVPFAVRCASCGKTGLKLNLLSFSSRQRGAVAGLDGS